MDASHSPTSTEEAIPTICAICGTGEHEELVLVCDRAGCSNEIHMYCMRPVLTEVPEGDWFCPACEVDAENKVVCSSSSGCGWEEACQPPTAAESLNLSILQAQQTVEYFNREVGQLQDNMLSYLHQSYLDFDDWKTGCGTAFPAIPSEFDNAPSLVGMCALVYSSVDSMYHSGRILARHASDKEYHLVHFKSGKDNRNRSTACWLNLSHFAVVVYGEVLWTRMQGFPWWPSQRIYRSGNELVKAGVVTKSERMQYHHNNNHNKSKGTPTTVRFFYDDTFAVISFEEAKQNIKPFDLRKYQIKSQAKKLYVAILLAAVEHEEQIRIRRERFLVNRFDLQYWCKCELILLFYHFI